jgi:hypothetical protein
MATMQGVRLVDLSGELLDNILRQLGLAQTAIDTRQRSGLLL